jgi:hypothetical protein
MQTTTSFYPTSATMEIPVFDPELQRLIDQLDHLDTSIPLSSLLCGAPQQDAECDSFAFAVDSECDLSLYDLCGGDPTLVDTIKWAYPGRSIASSSTPPLVAATPPAIRSPTSDTFDFPAPTVGGKWVPGFHPDSVPTYSHGAPTPLALSAPLTVPTIRPTSPDLAPASSHAGPSRSARIADHIRHQPYRKAAPPKREASGAIKGNDMGRAGRIETRDYLGAHPARVEDLTRVQGYRALIREGRWGPIILAAIRQIGVPYPTRGLQTLLAELYDGEGRQQGIPKGVKGRPAFPWKVSFKNFSVF